VIIRNIVKVGAVILVFLPASTSSFADERPLQMELPVGLKPFPPPADDRVRGATRSAEIWESISESDKAEFESRLFYLTEKMIGHRDVKITYQLHGSTDDLSKGRAEIASASEEKVSILFMLPSLQVYGIYRNDLDIPNVLEWEDDLKFKNTWADDPDRLSDDELMPKWERVKEFLHDVPRAALSLICEATRLSATGSVECYSQIVLWNAVGKENIPFAQYGEVKLEVINGSMVRGVHTLPRMEDPDNAWVIGEEEAGAIAIDYFKQKLPENPKPEDQQMFDRLKTTQRSCLKVVWVTNKLVNDAMYPQPRNAFVIVFGYGDPEWISVYRSLPKIYLDATTGEVYQSGATSSELHGHFLNLVNDLQQGRAFLFE